MSEAKTYSDVLDTEEALGIFLRALKKMESNFVRCMLEKTETSLKFEVTINQGELLNCRVYTSEAEQPAGAQRRLAKKIMKRLS